MHCKHFVYFEVPLTAGKFKLGFLPVSAEMNSGFTLQKKKCCNDVIVWPRNQWRGWNTKFRTQAETARNCLLGAAYLNASATDLGNLNKLLIPLPLMALDSFRQKVYCAIVDLSILFCIFQCVNTLFAMPRTHRDWKLRLSGCCGKPEQSLPYLRIIFNANNSHRTMNMKGSRSPHHSPIYGRVCNIDMDDIISGFNWSIT